MAPFTAENEPLFLAINSLLQRTIFSTVTVLWVGPSGEAWGFPPGGFL